MAMNFLKSGHHDYWWIYFKHKLIIHRTFHNKDERMRAIESSEQGWLRRE